MTKKISTPFATSSTKRNDVPVTTTTAGQASYNIGFPPENFISLASGGIAPNGEDFNGVLFDVTSNISDINKGLPQYFDEDFSSTINGYPLGARLCLNDNSGFVVSAIVNNTQDPNLSLTGWRKIEEESNISTVESIADLASLEVWNGRTVRVKGYRKATNFALAKPYKGGGLFCYNSAKANVNDGCIVFNGWERINIDYVTPYMSGAYGNFGQTDQVDDTQYFKTAIKAGIENGYYHLHIDEGFYYIVEGGIELTDQYIESTLGSRVGMRVTGANKGKSVVFFKAANDDDICFSIKGFEGGTHSHQIRDISITSADGAYLAPSQSQDFYKGQYFDWDVNATYKGIGIHQQGGCFVQYHNLDVYFLNKGIVFENTDLDYQTFNEFNSLSNCRLFKNNINHQLLASAKEGSFHGNSWHNVIMQVKDGGGVGLEVNGSSNKGAVLYNAFIDIHFFGGSTSFQGSKILNLVNGAQIINSSGNMTAEGGVVTISCDSDSYMYDFKGNFNYLYNTKLCWDVAESEQTNGLFGGKVEFANCKSWGSNLTGITNNDYEYQGSWTLQNLHATVVKSGQSPVIDGLTYAPIVNDLGKFDVLGKLATVKGNNYAGLILNTYNTGGTGGSANASVGYTVGQTTGSSDSVAKTIGRATYGINKYGQPQIDSLTGDSGVSGELNIRHIHRLGDATLSGVMNFKTTSIAYYPDDTTNGKIPSLGLSSNPFSNCYLQNAVTVVSDRNAKNSIQEIDDVVLQAWSEVKPKQYKLNGDDNWSFGYIAQDIVDAFTKHGLDYKKYNIVHEADGKFMLKYDMCHVLDKALKMLQ